MTVTQTLKTGQLDVIEAGVRRLIANNAGYMTGPGTNTYLLGRERFVVIDPGPNDPIHIERILGATGGAIDWICVTHTHPDHSPAARPLAQAAGARLLGCPAPSGGRQDATFAPAHVPADGELITFDGGALRALHTPGHASNHVCYLLEGTGLLFTGDHLMQGSTVVIAPPDGNMKAYLESLARLQREPVTRLAPGHGRVIQDAQAEIARIVAHRLQREAKVLEKLGAEQSAMLDELVVHVYDDVDSRLHPLAKCSLLAHLEKLELDGRARRAGAQWQLAERLRKAGQTR